MKKICTIYRSPKKEGMYLYVDKKEDLERVPAVLLKKFGKPELAMTLVIEPTRKLARVDVTKVLAGLDAEGYFLQMPPQADASMRAIHEKNSKM
ncbi:YcgL domain-containing protein [Oceanicoccus sp. KOV_DT_Chl]|uniref:YcgL domain-containing protein n=1 Tax=Oceanicoccus sp. KOV_DT_Chl TaxID=1904639 RepID=UPI000C7D5E1F|nr:YcgL domain-containing protein [Oceanicoccus sp. KOV_DT_Chl]